MPKSQKIKNWDAKKMKFQGLGSQKGDISKVGGPKATILRFGMPTRRYFKVRSATKLKFQGLGRWAGQGSRAGQGRAGQGSSAGQ